MTEQTHQAEAGTVAEILQEARRVLEVEAGAVQALAERLGEDFARAVQLLLDLPGRVVVSGLGKSGIVARKIAATLTSTGTAATFLHPIEGLHGDLGIVRPTDVAILVSKSGDTGELDALVNYLVRAGVPIIAMTGRTDSPLAT
jgi:arabinose-5-phosphate isomerase